MPARYRLDTHESKCCVISEVTEDEEALLDHFLYLRVLGIILARSVGNGEKQICCRLFSAMRWI